MNSQVHIKNGATQADKRSRNRKNLLIALSIAGLVVVTGAIYILGLKGVILVTGLLIAIPVGYLLLTDERYLIPIAILYSIFVGPFLMGVKGVPIGLLMDAMLLTGALGVALRALKHRDWSYFNVPGKYVVLIWVVYHVLQVGNPVAASRVAWFYVMRPAVAYPFLFFIAMNMLKTPADLRKVWAFVTAGITITILWGLIQHVNGYFDFEMKYLEAADAIHLVYIQGRWRIFGTLTSPAQYGVVVTIFGMIFLLLGVFLKTRIRYVYLVLALAAFTAMVFSGTRTAYIVIPLAIGAMVVLERKPKLYALSAGLGIIFLVVIMMPTNNYHVKRIQSVFKTEEDASFQVRENNRKAIMPFIYSHPLGGGLGSTGVWGMRFSPYTQLAQFAPDAGYMRVAVELGWVGFILYMILLIRLFFLSLMSFKKLTNPSLRVLGLALLSGLSTLFLIEYAQDINGKLPMNILLWILLAILIRLPNIQKVNTDECT
ncbi:MAG: O-antigen ligase family protein [Bacteroidota bacterium]